MSFVLLDDDAEVDIDSIIKYMENTAEESWCTKVYRTADGCQNCLIGHIYNMGGNKLCHEFEMMVATDYMVFPVNDGYSEKYTQPTPKQRCIAYLKDLRDGNALRTPEQFAADMALMDKWGEEWDPPMDFEALNREKEEFEQYLKTA